MSVGHRTRFRLLGRQACLASAVAFDGLTSSAWARGSACDKVQGRTLEFGARMFAYPSKEKED
jgi:hypothetical protein